MLTVRIIDTTAAILLRRLLTLGHILSRRMLGGAFRFAPFVSHQLSTETLEGLSDSFSSLGTTAEVRDHISTVDMLLVAPLP